MEENENAEALAASLDTAATQEVEAPADAGEKKGLSMDEALKAAWDKHEKGEEIEAPKPAATESRSDSKVSPASKETKGTQAVEKPETQAVEAPQEFNAREREAWGKGDLKSVRDGMTRVLRDRQAEVTRVYNESQPYRELAKQVEPYLRAAGNTGKPPAQAITEAVALAQGLKSDPVSFVREVVRLSGLKQEHIFGEQKNLPPDPHISALQSQVQSLTSRLESRDTETLGQQYGAIFQNLQATGKFPDLTDDERGIQLASQIGSLTRSPDFIRAVRAINPGAGLAELTVKAYSTLGGRIVEQNSVSSPQAKPQHIEKARRASASVPGRAPASTRAVPQKKYGDLGSALKAALEFHSE